MSVPENLSSLVGRIEQVLEHPLQTRSILESALTHRSFVNESEGVGLEDNERLEFLGDAVLSLLISHWLMERNPTETEGVLSKFRSAIVNERSLAEAARAMHLGRYLRLGKGEELTGGREKDSILANAFEAVVAAVYLTGGLDDASRFVRNEMASVLERAEQDAERFDFKTGLQEFTQRKLGTTPVYRLVDQDGPDHDKVFDSHVEINGRVYGRGRAKSKKDSEQVAAEEALRNLRQEMNQPVKEPNS